MIMVIDFLVIRRVSDRSGLIIAEEIIWALFKVKPSIKALKLVQLLNIPMVKKVHIHESYTHVQNGMEPTRFYFGSLPVYKIISLKA